MKRKNYIKSNLLKDENLLLIGHRHWVVFWIPVFWLLISVLFYFEFPEMRGLLWIPGIMIVVTFLIALIDYYMSEIGVTDIRVVIKMGLVARYTSETLLRNIASIKINQTFLGRLLNYGTVIVCDTGAHVSLFKNIENPIEFQKRVQTEIDKRFGAPAAKPSASVEKAAKELPEGQESSSH